MSASERYPNINTLWSDIIADELARSGVRDVVISPGSRSTPLVLSFASHPDLNDHSQLDERAAGFFALGIARATSRPVALLCTSGTAAANYYPAVCEADAAGVPLLLLTADRPDHLRGSGAPQTMDQVKLYGDRVRHYCSAGHPEYDNARFRALRAAMCHAVALSQGTDPGPVHCNFPFRKPLEPVAVDPDWIRNREVFPVFEGYEGRRSGRAWTQYFDGVEALPLLADALLRAERPLIIAGPDAAGDSYAAQLLTFAAERQIPVFAEAASQLRFRADDGLAGIGSADLLLRSEAFRAQLQPDCVLLLGGTATNAGMLRFLETREHIDVFQISSTLRRNDPAHSVTHHLHGDAKAMLGAMQRLLAQAPIRDRSAWMSFITRANKVAVAALENGLQGMSAGLEGLFLAELGQLLQEGTPLMLSNSMPVRDVETFLPVLRKSIPVYFNRGVNGIDGILSTALGIAQGSGNRTVLCIGDIAFLHNLNAVVGGRLASLPLTIVLLNNSGGEIFELLPVREFDPAFTRHFLTPPEANITALAQAMGLTVHRADDRGSFAAAFDDSTQAEHCVLIEVRTDIQESGQLRRDLLAGVAREVDTALDAQSLPGETNFQPVPVLRLLRPGAGTPVVFLHGFTRSAASWDSMSALLEGRPLYAVDLMGHGWSPVPEAHNHPSCYSLEYAADALEALFARWGFSDMHLVGYSMGGRTAMTYATRYGKRLRTLALLSANPGIEDDAARKTRRQQDDALAAQIDGGGLHAFVRYWSATPMFAAQKDADPLRWAAAMQDRTSNTAGGLAAALLGSGQGQQRSLWSELGNIDLPVFIAAGDGDGKYVEIAARMRDALPQSELRVFENAGHDLPFERERDIARALLDLWKRGEA
ncbi:2-succinyl-5-enolpyruvyl-6-hydroxy-3-cyclohexene-1-carboxylic-acid synthase [bacterium]|nr:2-succinyl-5-enolpyruvyl-6-hydroxy-3-cyclohexene-1-carboxylic-acid synthase [bacterium]